jgi:uncharacterized RDD family membrane protein YckC
VDAAAPEVAPVEQVTADSQPRDLARLAPHPRRLGAFVVDGAAVALAFGVAALLGQLDVPALARFTLLTVAVAFGVALAVVPGLSVWLTGGQTVGKALFGLIERRVDGTKPTATLRGLAWAVGRHSWGYLVIDVLGVGALAALVSPRRRCLHDLAFGSEVVYAAPDQRTQADWEARGRAFVEDLQAGLGRSRERFGWVAFYWAWLTKVVVGIAVAVFAVATAVFAIVKWINPAATTPPATTPPATTPPASTAPPPTTLPAPARVALWAATAGLTAATLVAAVIVLPTPEIVGTWDGIRVQRTGLMSMVGVGVGDFTEPNSGCVFRNGSQVWKIRGRGPRYTGSELWAEGSAGQNCTFKWSTTATSTTATTTTAAASTTATFELLDHNTLRQCSTSPFDGHQDCDMFRRTR